MTLLQARYYARHLAAHRGERWLVWRESVDSYQVTSDSAIRMEWHCIEAYQMDARGRVVGGGFAHPVWPREIAS
jgi:hypothetical protein